MIDYYETKEHPITKRMVLDAYKKVKANGKAAGVDDVTFEMYKEQLQSNLYKLWNRMTSGSYFPQVVKEKQIPKQNGKVRSLGISTVEDRIAQQVVKSYLEIKVEESFHQDSYGYRRGRSAHQAIETAWKRTRSFDWVIDLDIKSFFDTIDHELLMLAVQKYTKEKWVLMYIERWLKAGVLKEDGSIEENSEGSPQGAVISPLLANIFLHFTFDKWMQLNHPNVPFERYCDDIIVHAKSEKQANFIKSKITERLKQCKLTLNEEKTKIVYCRSTKCRMPYRNVSFDFASYTFRPKWCHTKNGNMVLFVPVMSRKAKKSIMDRVRRLSIMRRAKKIEELAGELNPKLRGWINYYCVFSKWTTVDLWYKINKRIIKWAGHLKKCYKGAAVKWLRSIYAFKPSLFAHWKFAHP